MRTQHFYCYQPTKKYSYTSRKFAKWFLSEHTDHFNYLVKWCRTTLGRQGKNWNIRNLKKLTSFQKKYKKYIFTKVTPVVRYIQFKNKNSYILYKLSFLL